MFRNLAQRNLEKLQSIPNVGPRVEADLVAIGITKPRQFIGKDPYKLYEREESKILY